jgi:acyl-coA dehydrogenase, type 2, C-terminal domain
MLPQIEARAAQTERDRMVPAENIALLKSTGLHRVFLPRAYGGYEAPCRC